MTMMMMVMVMVMMTTMRDERINQDLKLRKKRMNKKKLRKMFLHFSDTSD